MAQESLKGKTALVTGAALRLGRAIALELAREGVNVVVHYRRAIGEAEQLVGELQGLGVAAWSLAADFAKREEYESLLPRALALAGEVDMLVNSASIFPAHTLQEISFDDLTLNNLINAWVPFHLTRELARRGRPGKVVNLLDTRIADDDARHVAYILSKRLLADLTRRGAIAFGPEVTVNAVAPGLILPPRGKDMRYLEALSDTVPLRRHGEEGDITQAVLYLLESTFVTGLVIYVDGGRHLIEYEHG